MMQIVLMEASHVPAVVELEKQCFSMPWSEASVRSELDNPLSLWLVAVADGTVAGYIGSQAVLDEADVMNVAVSDSFRRQGIAQALVEELVRRLCGKGVRCLTLEVRASNTPAKSLYEKLGFAQVGRRPNYYRNPKEDALILRKEWAL